DRRGRDLLGGDVEVADDRDLRALPDDVRPGVRDQRAEQKDGERRAERAEEVEPPAASRRLETKEKQGGGDHGHDPGSVGDQRDGGERGEGGGGGGRAHGGSEGKATPL